MHFTTVVHYERVHYNDEVKVHWMERQTVSAIIFPENTIEHTHRKKNAVAGGKETGKQKIEELATPVHHSWPTATHTTMSCIPFFFAPPPLPERKARTTPNLRVPLSLCNIMKAYLQSKHTLQIGHRSSGLYVFTLSLSMWVPEHRDVWLYIFQGICAYMSKLRPI